MGIAIVAFSVCAALICDSLSGTGQKQPNGRQSGQSGLPSEREEKVMKAFKTISHGRGKTGIDESAERFLKEGAVTSEGASEDAVLRKLQMVTPFVGALKSCSTQQSKYC